MIDYILCLIHLSILCQFFCLYFVTSLRRKKTWVVREVLFVTARNPLKRGTLTIATSLCEPSINIFSNFSFHVNFWRKSWIKVHISENRENENIRLAFRFGSWELLRKLIKKKKIQNNQWTVGGGRSDVSHTSIHKRKGIHREKENSPASTNPHFFHTLPLVPSLLLVCFYMFLG